MARHVLVPVDDSEQSSAALDFALEEHADAKLTILTVIDPRNLYSTTAFETGVATNYEQLRETYETRADALLADAREKAAAHGVEVETERVIGEIARSILSYATEHDVDQIVIGSHGRSGASRILLGSVAESVIRRSPVPVTVVR
ncbi:universal stress protein [Haloferacaceae archaeon DSL9]